MMNKTQSLDACQYQLNGEWQFKQQGNDTWLTASVPGCNFTDLLANGLINDPFNRDNESSLQWIEQENWHYRKYFNLDEVSLAHSNIELVAEGLDTFCEIFINGNEVADSCNMFIGHRFSCREFLILGENLIEIHFRSPIKETMPQYLAAGYAYPAENDKSEEKLSVYCRKAPCHFGWDWGPRFVTSGIWRDIYLQPVTSAKIEDLYFTIQHLSDEVAEFSFQLETAAIEKFKGKMHIKCKQAPELDQILELTIPAVKNNQKNTLVDINFRLCNPKKWWPNGLGEAFLYHFTFALVSNGHIVSSLEQKVGLRTLEVVNEKDPEGECFYLKVNGHKVFMKGANYIPADSFIHRVTTEKHQAFFTATQQANMNMLRVWGGGVYQDDIFYQLADEHGILIWQDFMFACTLYPADDAFLENVQQEANYNIRRLRNHPSVALWCGNNEVDMAINHWDWPEKFDYSEPLFERFKTDYKKLFETCLREAVLQHDPQRFYLRSSPIGAWESDEDHIGNHHYWGVWHGEEPFSEYQKRIPRFMSEYGFQSFPLLSSLKKFTDKQDQQLESAVMQVHQKHPRGNSLINSYLKQEFKPPKDFESLLYISQVQQALGLKLAFEAHRQAMPFCMGTLYWQLNDTWPAASWSGIDYYGKWKALHYQAKRSFAEQLLVVNHDDDGLTVNLVSDRLSSFDAQLELAIVSFDGKSLWSHSNKIQVKANTSQEVFNTPSTQLLGNIDTTKSVFIAKATSLDGQHCYCENTYFFVPNKQLALKQAQLDIVGKTHGNILQLTLSASGLLRQVYLDIPAVAANFSDNFFDLIPGQTKTLSVVLSKSELNNAESLLEQLSWTSLYDSFTEK
jgi:beta-mannosidase